MIGLDIRADVRQAQRFLSNLKKGAVRKAASRAINDALITVRADGARSIKQEHPALKIGDIKHNMAMDRATPSSLKGAVRTKGRPLSLLLFQPRGGMGSRRSIGPRGQVSLVRTSKPITARIGKNRAVVQHQGRKGFQVLMYGNEIFVRRFAKGRQIRRFRGPSMPGVFRARSADFKQLAEKRWAVTFPSRLRYEIELSKR